MTPVSITTARIKAATSIVMLIGGYVKLKKTGKRHTGLCPLHHEKSPSFTVDAAKQQWRCYGCGAWGDCFDFVAKIEGIDFKGARRELAELAGISMEGDKLTPENARAWAAERRAIERDLPAARLWRRVALNFGEDLLEALKEGLWDPQSPMQPRVGEIAEWTRRIARWRSLDGAELAHEYNSEREFAPERVAAMVTAAREWERVDHCALTAWLRTNEAVSA